MGVKTNSDIWAKFRPSQHSAANAYGFGQTASTAYRVRNWIIYVEPEEKRERRRNFQRGGEENNCELGCGRARAAIWLCFSALAISQPVSQSHMATASDAESSSADSKREGRDILARNERPSESSMHFNPSYSHVSPG